MLMWYFIVPNIVDFPGIVVLGWHRKDRDNRQCGGGLFGSSTGALPGHFDISSPSVPVNVSGGLLMKFRTNPRLRCLLLAAFSIAIFASLCLAQTAGARLEGVVRDASQAVIPGVTVTATNEATGISFTSMSGDTGLYVFVSLPPGPYTLTSELPGFKRYVRKGMVLTVGATATVHITLETGDISTEVVVSAAAPLIDVTSHKIGAVVQEQQIVDLPILGRNPMMFYYLQGGTNPIDAQGGQQAVGSVDGLRTNASNVKIDGVWASDASYDMSPAAPNVAVPLEAVGEYRVTTSSATADAGRGAGAQVQVVYKSGTNEFHGSVFEFNRNTAYNAGHFFANKSNQPRPKFLRNQYGASLGGPIVRNKTFFFGTWEGQKEIQGEVRNFLTYTQNVRDGIFRFNTTGAANSTTMVDAQTGAPRVPFSTINLLTVDPSRQGFDTSGRVALVLKEMPLPNNYDTGDGFNTAGYRFLANASNDYNQFVGKLDHSLSTKHQINLSLGGYWRKSKSSFFPNGYAGADSEELKHNMFVGIVSALSPTLTNEWRAGATRRKTHGGPENPANFDPKGVFQLSGLGSARTGSNNIGVYLPQRNPIVAFNISDNISWVVRNHTFKFGFEVTHSTKNNWFGGDDYIPAVYTATANNPASVPAQTGLQSADRTRAQQLVNDLTGTIGHIT
ncbi:MAG: carboxypeptidase regulatory-like domain-containing protein, partial [Acidobacteria bacterium]|nr:carboxypeptidase regulatory-like domain-containing protein [Acidobacteriota bacterium]